MLYKWTKIIFYNFFKNFQGKKIWTKIQTLDPPDPKGLGHPNPNFSDPVDFGSSLGPIKKIIV